MALFNNFKTPQQVRDELRQRMTSQAYGFHRPGAAMLGMAIGAGASKLFGMEPRQNAQIRDAEVLQGLRGQWRTTLAGIDLTSLEGKIEGARIMANDLVKAGRPDLAWELSSRLPQGRQDKSKLIKQHRDSIAGVTKNMRVLESAYEKIKSVGTSKTAAGDMALLFQYMKLLDPNSTVREGEYATAQQAGSVPQRIIAMYNSTVDGQLLSDQQRADFLTQSDRLYGAERTATDKSIENILELADVDEIERSVVMGDERLKSYRERKKTRKADQGSTMGETGEASMPDDEYARRKKALGLP
jgi:hypothetical protein